MKKLLIIIILLVTAAVGFYLVTGQTPLPMPLEKYSRQYKKRSATF